MTRLQRHLKKRERLRRKLLELQKKKKRIEEKIEEIKEEAKVTIPREKVVKKVAYRAWALYLHNHYMGEMVPVEVVDGSIRLGDKRWDVEGAHPILVKKGLTAFPLWILDWKSTKPCALNFYPTRLTPKMYRTIEETRILQELFQKKRFILRGGDMMILGMMVGMIILFILIKAGLIPM